MLNMDFLLTKDCMPLVNKTGWLNMDFLLTKDCMPLVTKTGWLNMDFLLTKDAMTLVTKNVMLTKEFIQTLGRTSRPLPPLTKGSMQSLVTPTLPATMRQLPETRVVQAVHERMASSYRSSRSSLVWGRPRP